MKDGKPELWAHLRGARVYNESLLSGASDSEFELAIGQAIESAYLEGLQEGQRTLEERLGA